MDNTAWMAPPGAAQPSGIQSTAGAVPIWNEKGKYNISYLLTFILPIFLILQVNYL